jgi:sporulation protein YlmC with PRC-barrel domain
MSPSSYNTAQTIPGDDAEFARAGRHPTAGPGPDVIGASKLDGNKVLSSEGEDVGKIKEIMLDVRSGHIAYAVLSVGGFLGIGDKLLAVPWNALALDTENKSFVLSVPAEQIKNAPGFDKDNWPAMADPKWAATVHAYYGSEPYWGRGTEGRAEELDDLRLGESVPDSPASPVRGDVDL